MKPIDIIKRKVKELDNLRLNFTYQNSGNVNEIRRVASLVFNHFGLTNVVDVTKKAALWGPTKYTFLVNGEEVCKYDSFGEPGNPMGHANTMMCIQDMLSYTMPKEKTIRLDGRDIPCKDVISIRPVTVSDVYFSEFTCRLFEPCYHEVKVLVPHKKAYALEKTVRKACCR